MPIVTQHRYYRSDAQANRHVLYVFGDNDEREGYGGQAKEMRDEPNAVGVRTKWSPDMQRASFFYDDDYELATTMIDEDLRPVIAHLDRGGIVVFPADGLGTGLSELPQRAPRINEFIQERVAALVSVYNKAVE